MKPELTEAGREYEALCDRLNDQAVLLTKVRAENEQLRHDSQEMSRLREAIRDALQHSCTQMRELLTEALR